MTQLCRIPYGASFQVHVQPRAVPAAGLSLGIPVRGTTHFAEDQGLKSVTTILRMEHFGPNRAEQEGECKHCEGGCMTWQHRDFGVPSHLYSSFTTKPCLSFPTCKNVYHLTAPLSG